MSVNVTRVVKFRRKPAVLRGPQAWSDCADGYSFQSGGDGDEWKDVVMYGDNFYSCMVNHSKTPTNYPGSSDDQANGYWRLGDKIELVATKLLLAQYALVKNLGVECIDMKDAEGNILFQAKDGNVTCKTGTFENISVSGGITAYQLNLKRSTVPHFDYSPGIPNGSACVRVSGITLPELPANSVRRLLVFNPEYLEADAAVAVEDLLLKAATDKVRISQSLSIKNAQSQIVLKKCGLWSGKFFELIGYNHAYLLGDHYGAGTTYWLVSEIHNGLITEQ